MENLTLALLADIHYGEDKGTKKGSCAIELLAEFRNFVDDLKPDATIEFGDRISDSDQQTDRILMSEIGHELQKISGTVYHLLGNHDIAKLTQEENEAALGCNLNSHSVDKKGFHLVFWNTHPSRDMKTGLSLSNDDLVWLRKDLASTQLPTIIFTHVPLDNGSMKGSFYFEKEYPLHASYPEDQGEAIRDVIERSNKVVLCVNAHLHTNNYQCIDGIHYVTIPSLTETFTTWPAANGAWAKLSIGAFIEVEVFGKTPIFYRMPIKKLGDHWVNNEKDYSPFSTPPK